MLPHVPQRVVLAVTETAAVQDCLQDFFPVLRYILQRSITVRMSAVHKFGQENIMTQVLAGLSLNSNAVLPVNTCAEVFFFRLSILNLRHFLTANLR